MTHRTLKNVSSTPDLWDWVAVRDHCLTVTRRILVSQAAAEDAAQEALLRAWRAASRGGVRNPDALVARIARNEALRVGSRESELSRRQVAGEAVDLPAEEDEELGAVERISASALIASLPVMDRQVLLLRYLGDLTQTEVAHRLGIPEGTAKVRLHRARKRLERELRKGRV